MFRYKTLLFLCQNLVNDLLSALTENKMVIYAFNALQFYRVLATNLCWKSNFEYDNIKQSIFIYRNCLF